MADAPGPDTPWLRMAFHATLAAAVFFALNRYALDQPFETSLTWAAVAAPAAAYVAWRQGRQ